MRGKVIVACAFFVLSVVCNLSGIPNHFGVVGMILYGLFAAERLDQKQK